MYRTTRLPDIKFKKAKSEELRRVLSMVEIRENGLECECNKCDALTIIEYMVLNHNWEYGDGKLGEGLYTPSWGELKGEWCVTEIFVFDASIIYNYLIEEY